MYLDLGHLSTFFAIALLSGLAWQANVQSYFWAVVGAAVSGTVVAYLGAYVAFEPVLGRAPHWSILVVSLPLCAVVAAAAGIPFSLQVLEEASVVVMISSALVLYGLIRLAESWGTHTRRVSWP